MTPAPETPVPDARASDTHAPSGNRPGRAEPPGPDRSGMPAAAGRRRRRWHRVAIPLGAVAVLLAVTGITRAIDQPDPGSVGFLSPVNVDDEGGSRLADRLRNEGVTVERFTSTRRALIEATSRGFTLFVPSPGWSTRSTFRTSPSRPSAPGWCWSTRRSGYWTTPDCRWPSPAGAGPPVRSRPTPTAAPARCPRRREPAGPPYCYSGTPARPAWATVPTTATRAGWSGRSSAAARSW
ncbi:hypothetical protein GCM10027615_26440 [Plantactinospora veratri]